MRGLRSGISIDRVTYTEWLYTLCMYQASADKEKRRTHGPGNNTKLAHTIVVYRASGTTSGAHIPNYSCAHQLHTYNLGVAFIFAQTMPFFTNRTTPRSERLSIYLISLSSVKTHMCIECEYLKIWHNICSILRLRTARYAQWVRHWALRDYHVDL